MYNGSRRRNDISPGIFVIELYIPLPLDEPIAALWTICKHSPVQYCEFSGHTMCLALLDLKDNRY